MIIGITGTIGAGKGAIVDYLVRKKGFTHYSMSGFLTEELRRRNLPLLRENMHLVADEIRKEHGPGYLVEFHLDKAHVTGNNTVIESIRSLGEVEALKKEPNSILLAVDADVKTRYQRILNRKSSKDMVSFEKFVEAEQSESVQKEIWAMNLVGCMQLAEFVIKNNGSMSDLYKQVDAILEKIK
ncbi:TPA: hypothetical protein DCQ44_01675 [Candidatus Taylorbacteria bacterium]|nr:hypothetical protein [Candidatus Taylorbacteria bacterium]